MRLVLVAALCCLEICAQENRYEGQNVEAIAFDPPGNYLDPKDLAPKISALAVGEPLRMANVRITIERLFGTGRFENIQVDAVQKASGVLLTFRVTPASFIRNVIVEGATTPPNRSQLANVTNLQLGEHFYTPMITQSVDRIMDLLRTDGLYLASVAAEKLPEPDQQLDLLFKVDPGQRARYAQPVVQGSPNKSVDELVRLARWRKLLGYGPFREVTDARMQQGLDRIRRAYQKKEYLLARVSLDHVEYRPADNRAVPNLTVDSGPRVSVRTEGARISRGKLRELVPIFQEQTVDRDLLMEGKRDITEYLQSKGYFEAEVDFEQTREKDRELILYSVAPGDRHKLVHVEITGNKYFPESTIRERLYTVAADLIRFRRGRFSQEYLRRDVNAIRVLYSHNGFRDVDVKTRVEDDYNGRTDETAVFFTITEGPQWFVNSLTVDGIDPDVLRQLRGSLQSDANQPYSELNVSADSDTILTYFYNSGYPDARLDPSATPVEGKNRMDVRYVLQSGRRRYVREVLISGLDATRADLVMSRIRNLEPGSPLEQGSMIESQRRLYDLGIFARVDTALQNADGDTDHKYVLYRFEEASRWSLNGGIGAQIARIGKVTPTLDTPAGSPGFAPRLSFGVSRNNFLGIAHTITAQTQWAPGLRQRYLLSYLAPQFKGYENLSLTLTGIFDDSRDVSTFTSKRREASAQISQRLNKSDTVQYRIAWRRITVSDVAITPALIPLFAQPVQLATVSGTFIQDRRDNPLDARRGMWNTMDGTFASNILGAPRTSFTRLLGRNATYHRINRDLTLARQLSFGTDLRHAAADIPLPERFFAGGVSSHRGFPDNQAGPRDPLTGFPIGGKALLMHNTELRFPLVGENTSGVFFHDAGNVYSSPGNISLRVSQRDLGDFDYMVHAIGFGIRYRTPVGPVRVDLAWSINSPRFNGLKGTREQLLNPDAFGSNCANLSIGCVQYVQQRISRFQFHFSLGQLF